MIYIIGLLLALGIVGWCAKLEIERIAREREPQGLKDFQKRVSRDWGRGKITMLLLGATLALGGCDEAPAATRREPPTANISNGGSTAQLYRYDDSTATCYVATSRGELAVSCIAKARP